MAIKIEPGVKITKPNRGRPRGDIWGALDALQKSPKGSSFVCGTTSANIRQIAKRAGVRITTRAESHGFRVWLK